MFIFGQLRTLTSFSTPRPPKNEIVWVTPANVVVRKQHCIMLFVWTVILFAVVFHLSIFSYQSHAISSYPLHTIRKNDIFSLQMNLHRALANVRRPMKQKVPVCTRRYVKSITKCPYVTCWGSLERRSYPWREQILVKER